MGDIFFNSSEERIIMVSGSEKLVLKVHDISIYISNKKKNPIYLLGRMVAEIYSYMYFFFFGVWTYNFLRK